MAIQRPDTPLASTPDPKKGKISTLIISDTIKGRDIPLAETKVRSEVKIKDSQSGGKSSSGASSYTEVTKPDGGKNTQYSKQSGDKYSSTFVTRDSSGKVTAAQKESNGKTKYTDNPSRASRWEAKAKK
jgi:hypothetical protein